MELVVIRHAKAEDFAKSGGDTQRALVAKGFDQSNQVGAFLKAHDLVPDVVLTSPYLRSRQTAETICKELDFNKLLEQQWLACGMRPETALSELQSFREFERVAIVGHEPDLSNLINHCLGASYPGVDVKKASITFLELQLSRGIGVLKFLIPPKFL